MGWVIMITAGVSFNFDLGAETNSQGLLHFE